MNQPTETPPTEGATIAADYKAIRLEDDGPLCWLWTGVHVPCAPDAPTCNAPGCCGEGVWS